jgi:hypothetical protein
MISLNHLISHWQPVVVLFLGGAVVTFYYYLHTRLKQQCVAWIAKHIFRNENAIPSGENAFNVTTSYILMFGGMFIVLALYYLAND